VDLQLRGRAGRQGDPGATRFFVSLEDPLIETYGAFELIPPEHRPQRQPGPVGDPVVAQEIARAQRIVEGACFEMRRQQWCYSKALEAQRQPLQEWRRAVLEGAEPLELLASRRPERWAAARARFGDDECLRLERRLTLLAVDRCWSDHLALARRIRDGIHVAAFAGKEPLAEYTRELIAAFGEFQRLVEDEIVARFEAVPLDERGIDWRQQALLGPSSTWTYLVHETPFGSNPMRGLLARRGPALAAATLAAPFFVAWSLVLRYQTWRRRRASARAQSDSS